jgi:hypothetical protein
MSNMERMSLQPTVAPIYISFMLACFVSPDPKGLLGEAVWTSRAGQDTQQWLLEHGLIDINNRATERGEAWVRFICETPLPVHVWQRP